MTTSPQLLIVETLFLSSGTKRATYVLVMPKEAVAVETSPEAEAAAFTLGLGRPQSAADAAAIFVLSTHDDDEMAYHSVREGILLEADEVVKRAPDTETDTFRIWFVAEVR